MAAGIILGNDFFVQHEASISYDRAGGQTLTCLLADCSGNKRKVTIPCHSLRSGASSCFNVSSIAGQASSESMVEVGTDGLQAGCYDICTRSGQQIQSSVMVPHHHHTTVAAVHHDLDWPVSHNSISVSVQSSLFNIETDKRVSPGELEFVFRKNPGRTSPSPGQLPAAHHATTTTQNDNTNIEDQEQRELCPHLFHIKSCSYVHENDDDFHCSFKHRDQSDCPCPRSHLSPDQVSLFARNKEMIKVNIIMTHYHLVYAVWHIVLK